MKCKDSAAKKLDISLLKNLDIVPIKDIPKGEKVPTDDIPYLINLFKLMEDICKKNNGIGLSAVQVGIPYNAFMIFDYKTKKPGYFLNCDYSPASMKKIVSTEGCLSLMREDGKLREFVVKRYPKVGIVGKELLLEPSPHIVDIDFVIGGFYSVVYQHEIDHQRGVLISDLGFEKKPK